MIKKPLLLVVGIIAILIGLVWAGQGAGILPGSMMTGDPTWLVIGLILIVAGAVLGYLSTRGRSWHSQHGPPGQH
ncbi:hypothetical protein EXU48_05125 [Occultella glacieicola]|uniref:DUF3185 family protein n=1 Tax=Occultella glacieicola TaxID=2518684 RepID=A0ABY2E7M9_9MICO|nr:hypothetical protein [Occultella glacieicola]TDE97565.1 hypothetical protein EXU48_05125 [Occultella glacieicola]